jgi:hypothetical protein
VARLLLCCAGALLGCMLLAATASAAPPANNNFASAATLSTESLVIASNVEATKQGGEPNHAGNPGGASVWYSWTAPSTGKFEVTTCGSQFDTLLAVYTGSAVNALTQVASNDDAFRCPTESDLVLNATSGVNYKIAVDGFGGDTGDFLLGVFAVTPPSNDSFSTPADEGGDSDWSEFGENISATKQTGEPNHAGNAGGASVWYSWTAPITGHYRLNTCYTEFDTVLAVYTGSAVGSLTPVASDHNSCGDGSFLQFDAVSGTVYRIAVDGFGGAMGNFQIVMHHLNPPPNDNFANAQTISGSSAQVTGTNLDAGVEPGETAHFAIPASASVWYSWTAPASGQVTIDTCDSDFDTVLAVYTGNAVNGLTAVAGNDQACGNGDQSRASFAATAGTTYRIVVDGYFGDEGDIDLRLALTVPQLAPKDLTPPQSSIRGVKLDSNDGKATIRFGSSEAGSSFKCKLDHGPFKACHSPKTYRHLDAGKHKVKIEALDAAGNLDATPAVKSFKIKP